MSNVDTEGVRVNAHRRIGGAWNVEPAERRPEERSGRQEVAHGLLPILQTYVIANEQRVAGSLPIYKEIEACAVGRRYARDAVAANAELGLGIVPLEDDFAMDWRKLG